MAAQVEATRKVWKVTINRVNYNFEMSLPYPIVFCGRNLHRRPSITFGIVRHTQFPNIAWLRLTALHIGPPWVVHQACFTNTSN